MQESGVPNVTGGFGGSGLYMRIDQVSAAGPFTVNEPSEWPNCSYGGGEVDGYFKFDLSRVSLEYQPIKEVRMKNVCSNGFIRLY